MTMGTVTRWILCCCALGAVAGSTRAIELNTSPLDQAQVEARYGLVSATDGDLTRMAETEPFVVDDDPVGIRVGEKSPGKAFLLSLVVPGAGQWYYGSRIKPFVFLGLEALAWGLHADYHYNGEDLTDEFEAFNRAHWSRDDYANYLDWAYGLTIEDLDTTVIPGLTHHLPDTRTQQYYEMTGKYDQFSWGWDDANLDGSVLGTDFDSITTPPTIDQAVPTSANRDKYETMRDDANHEYKKAGRALVGVVANHIFSAFEAYFMTKHRNNQLPGADRDNSKPFLSRLSVKPSLKSVYSRQDTPYVKVTYTF